MGIRERLVYAEDVLERIERERAYMTDVGRIHARSAVNTAPTADAEPVKHGRWVIKSNGKGAYANNWAVCSECHVVGSPQWKRCPVCEAKMDLSNITAKAKEALDRMGQEAHGGAADGDGN